MSNFLFFTIQPDDYHGAPMLGQAFPDRNNPGNSKFPKIPTEKEIFDLWMEAGYNSFHMGYDGMMMEMKRINKNIILMNMATNLFFYHIYFITMEDDMTDIDQILNSSIEELVEITYEGTERKLEGEEFVEMVNIKIGESGRCFILI